VVKALFGQTRTEGRLPEIAAAKEGQSRQKSGLMQGFDAIRREFSRRKRLMALMEEADGIGTKKRS
jgi:hypothetical protein